MSAGGWAKQQQGVYRHLGLAPGQPGLWWGSKSLEVGGGKRGEGEGGTGFSFKAKGELCQLTASTCAGPLTRQWEQSAGTLHGRSRELTLELPLLPSFCDPGKATSLWVLYFILLGDAALPHFYSGWFYMGLSNHKASKPDVCS